MDLLHETVSHKRFGRGRIVSFDGHIVRVLFESAGERDFSYPDAFGSFLSADHPEIQFEAEAALREKKADSGANINRIEQDIEILRAAARKKTAAPKTSGKRALPKEKT